MAAGLLWFLFLYTAALYLLLMLRDTIPSAAMVLFGILWLGYAILNRRLAPATPLNLPILLLLLLLPVSYRVSIDTALSLTKIFGLVLSAGFFFLVVNALRIKLLLLAAIAGFPALALGICLLGLIGSDWSLLSSSFLSPIYNRLPHLIESVPRSTFNGINVNTIGGALTFFFPMFILLLWNRSAILSAINEASSKFRVPRWLYTLFMLGGLGLVSLTLLLTQSRGAVLGILVGTLAVAIWKDRRFLWALPASAVVVLLVFLLVAHGSPSQLLAMLDTNQYNTLSGRLEAWRNTIYLIQDFPLTGAGIGTYSKLFSDVYTFIPFSLQGAGSYHAHNLLLAVTIDLGIPGLLLYVAIHSAAAAMALRATRTAPTLSRTLLMALTCGLLAHQIFGITDAFLLGTKLGLILWLFLGVLAALYNQEVRSASTPSLFANAARGIVLWLLFSAAALSLAVVNIYASLGIALVLGIAMGILLVLPPGGRKLELATNEA